MPTARLGKRLPWVTLSPGMAGVTSNNLTLQVCSYNALTDVPTVVFDLNDKTTTFVHAQSFKMPQPDKTWVRSGNVRTPGEKISKFQYRNRHIMCSIWIRGASTNAIQNSIHALIAAIEPPPYMLKVALPGSTTYSWADVVAVKHNVPPDPVSILGGAQTHIELDFECRPGLRGNRITLSNLVTNPGFEAPSGPGVTVFSDSFANANAYAVQSGGAPAVAANVLTIPSGGRVAFGSPAWGAINTWQIRFQFATGLTANFFPHLTDGNNYLICTVNGTAMGLSQDVAGTVHTMATSGAFALTNGTFYWLTLTQFPGQSGNPPYVAATLNNDSAGSIGTAVANGAIAALTFDAVTALSGRPQIGCSGASLAIGGNFANVHTVALFGPGGWRSGSSGTGAASGAWEQNTANTYSGGPVQSFGAARLDAAPAGTLNASWFLYGGGAPAGTNALPVRTVGDVIQVSGWARSSGLGGGAVTSLVVREFDATGTFLRQTTVATLTGNQAAWAQLAGSVATGATCTYVDALLNSTDNSAGASANGTVWFDNAQCWNQTTTGAAPGAMPYCELRFPSSPAQLLVSGLLGEIPAPCALAIGTYVTSFAPTNTFTFQIGQRALASPGARLVGAVTSSQAAGHPLPILDASSYGGYYSQATALGGFLPIPMPVQLDPATYRGTYHVRTRAKTSQATFSAVYLQNLYLQFAGAKVFPFTAANTWTSAVDVGYLPVPSSPPGGLQDQTLASGDLWVNFQDPVGGSSGFLNWVALLPVDGGLLSGTVVNGFTSGLPSFTVSNSWIFLYSDALRLPQGSGASWTSSYGSPTPLPNQAAGVGGPTNPFNEGISGASVADPYLALDPTVHAVAGAPAVNQLVAVVTDAAATVYPVVLEVVYSPQYLTLR